MEKNSDLSAVIEVLKNLAQTSKDHETRLRRIEYILATAVGALAVFKFLIEKSAGH